MKWPLKSLAELAAAEPNSLVDGPFGSNLKASEYQDAGVPIVRLQNVRPNLFLHKDIKFISDRKAASLKRHDFRTGDLVIAKLGDPCAVACIVPEGFPDGRLVADVVRFRGKPDVVDHRYVAYFLNAPAAKAQVDAGTTGTTRKRVNLTRLKALVLPLPPLAEQRRIAEVLDRAEALRAKRRAALAQLDSLTQSLFLDLFGDLATNPKRLGKETLEQLTLNITDGKHGDCRPSSESGYFFVSVKDIKEGQIDYSDARQIDRDDFMEVHKRTRLEPGDVLITNSGTIGKTAVVAACPELERTTFQKSVAIVKPRRERLESLYLKAALDMCVAKLTKESSGSSQKNLLLGQLRNFPVCVPPISLQREFARRVTAVERLKTAHHASLAELDALFATLQHRAFKGEL